MKRAAAWAAIAAVIVFSVSVDASGQISPEPTAASTPIYKDLSGLDNPKIIIEYVKPNASEFLPIYDNLRRRKVLEQIKAFLAPLQLPSPLTINISQCDAKTSAYASHGSVTLCYEYVSSIAALAPSDTIFIGPGYRTKENRGQLTRDDALTGPVVHHLFHGIGEAVLNNLGIPVWGRIEDASDNMAAFIMMQFGKDIAWKTLVGSSWFLSQSGSTGLGFDFTYVRSLEIQRFYNLLCFAYGADPKAFAFLVTDNNLPQERARRCAGEYKKFQYAFSKVIMPHVDLALLKRVQRSEWLR